VIQVEFNNTFFFLKKKASGKTEQTTVYSAVSHSDSLLTLSVTS